MALGLHSKPRGLGLEEFRVYRGLDRTAQKLTALSSP